MAAQKINALTNLATPDPTMLMYAGLSPFGVTDDRKITANALFSEITANVTDVSVQFGNGVAAAVSAAGKGKIIYNDTTKTFQVSADAGAYTSLLSGSGANTRLAFWTGTGTLSSSANLTWVSPALTIGVASSATGLLTLANSAGATTTSFQAGNAAASLVYIWPTVSPTVGQVLSASAPSGANVTLSWVANGGGGTPSAPEGGIQFNSSSAFDADADFLWDTANQQLLIGGVALAGGQAPIDVVADAGAIAQQWREAGAGTCRIQMQIPASFGQFGTSSNHAFSLITNGTQHLNVEATGAVVVGTILTATGTLMSNAIATGDIALVANNAAGTTVDIARFQVNAGNRFRFLNTGEAIFGTASANTGTLTLANAAGATLTSISAGNAASTLNFIWPVVDPTAGQILSASAPSGSNVTLSWVANSAGGIGGTGSVGSIARFVTNTTTIGDSIMTESGTTITTAGRQTISGLTINTDADLTVASLTSNWTLTKNDTNPRTFYGALFQPTFNSGGSNTATVVNILAVDSTNTATTGLTINLLNLAYGGSQVFNVDSAGAMTFANGVRQAFTPDATNPGLNVGSVNGDPSSPVDGDLWYDGTGNLLRARINGATVSLGAGGGSGITVGTTTITSGVSGSVPYNNAGVYGETNLTWASPTFTQTINSIGTTPTDGLVLINTTDAAAGAQQNSPEIHFTSEGWRTTATAATRVLDWRFGLRPLEGTTNPANRLVFSQQVNAGGFAEHSVLGVSQAGTSYASFPGGSETEWPGVTVGLNFNTQASPVINGLFANAGGSWFIVRPAANFGTHGTGMSLLSGGLLQWSNNATSLPTGTLDTFMGRAGAANIRHGAANAASPIAQTISTQGSRPGTDTDVDGANLTIQAGIGTGAGAGALARLILQSPIAVASGTGAQTSTTGLIIINGTARLTSYTVATLPAAATAGAGATAFVTDSNATMTAGIGATVAGGGANQVPVYSDGTNWIIG